MFLNTDNKNNINVRSRWWYITNKIYITNKGQVNNAKHKKKYYLVTLIVI